MVNPAPDRKGLARSNPTRDVERPRTLPILPRHNHPLQLGPLPFHNHRDHIVFLAKKGERQKQAAEQACLGGRPTLLGYLFAFHFPALSREAVYLRRHLLAALHRIREHQRLIFLGHK